MIALLPRLLNTDLNGLTPKIEIRQLGGFAGDPCSSLIVELRPG
jgi:hypothetical protein